MTSLYQSTGLLVLIGRKKSRVYGFDSTRMSILTSLTVQRRDMELVMLLVAGEPGGDVGQADNSAVDGADGVAAGRCDGSHLQRVYLRQVLRAAAGGGGGRGGRSLLAAGQVQRAADAVALSHRSRPVAHYRR